MRNDVGPAANLESPASSPAIGEGSGTPDRAFINSKKPALMHL